ncbi:hypothetical protein OE810_10965 [Rhodobacteraceae bacterium XHP0102]|nr:hypothetical protein [Rhodobacteraceae bacterium XHP0102]
MQKPCNGAFMAHGAGQGEKEIMAQNSTKTASRAPQIWALLMGIWIFLGGIVPYGLLSQSPFAQWTFAFWTVFGLGVIALILWPVLRWNAAPSEKGKTE